MNLRQLLVIEPPEVARDLVDVGLKGGQFLSFPELLSNGFGKHIKEHLLQVHFGQIRAKFVPSDLPLPKPMPR